MYIIFGMHLHIMDQARNPEGGARKEEQDI